ncbi:uncharacterized protein P884DRAFT_331324 [Thermothelomyces heterothallicus CBS 202.75]|uniref:uncharacterized protein n=1 Tax=Thermothelomyces heterothallicus CBS 202.75 TaxID=1149848 RepID=UPI003742D1DA
MPPPLFDEAQIHNALRNEALPELARLAADDRLRELAVNRFDRDEPPPYVSSTEDDEYYENELPLGVDGNAVLEEFADVLNPPLDDTERDMVAIKLWYYAKVYEPGHRYRQEARVEEKRVRSLWWKLQPANDDAKKFLDFVGRPGDERVNIIVRRNIKRRWRKLGVWNPQWGIPGRRNSTNPNDDASKWKWWWQHGDAAAEWTPSATATATNPKHPITRALELRRDLQRGEHAPVMPRSRLPDDASASQAESFIMSRPWAVYQTDYVEELQRFNRIPPQKARHYLDSMAKPVIERWKSRGDWKDEWGAPDSEVVPGWKWRHESPSPEPEDLTPLETMDLEFTPSEVDALEAIRPPTPPPPPRAPSPRHFPSGDQTVPSGTGLFSSHPLPRAPPTPPAADDAAPEVPEPAQAAPQQQQQQPRRRPRQRNDEQPAQPVRRSARIAAMNKANPPAPAPAPAPPPQARQSRQRAARAPAGQQPAGRPKTDRSTRAQRRAAASDTPSARSGQAEKPTTARSRGRPKKKTARR